MFVAEGTWSKTAISCSMFAFYVVPILLRVWHISIGYVFDMILVQFLSYFSTEKGHIDKFITYILNKLPC